jgi:hypothetical protein
MAPLTYLCDVYDETSTPSQGLRSGLSAGNAETKLTRGCDQCRPAPVELDVVICYAVVGRSKIQTIHLWVDVGVSAYFCACFSCIVVLRKETASLVC